MSKTSAAARDDALDAAVDHLDLGGAGELRIYNAAQTGSPEGSPSGTLLVTLALSNPAFGSASAGVATASAITDGTVAAAGTALGYVMFNGSGTGVFSGSVSATGGGGSLVFDTNVFTVGGTVSVTSFTMTLGEGS
jgi:hypothetical protein